MFLLKLYQAPVRFVYANGIFSCVSNAVQTAVILNRFIRHGVPAQWPYIWVRPIQGDSYGGIFLDNVSATQHFCFTFMNTINIVFSTHITGWKLDHDYIGTCKFCGVGCCTNPASSKCETCWYDGDHILRKNAENWKMCAHKTASISMATSAPSANSTMSSLALPCRPS